MLATSLKKVKHLDVRDQHQKICEETKSCMHHAEWDNDVVLCPSAGICLHFSLTSYLSLSNALPCVKKGLMPRLILTSTKSKASARQNKPSQQQCVYVSALCVASGSCGPEERTLFMLWTRYCSAC